MAILALVSPLFLSAGGCGFEHGALSSGPILTNAVACECTFAESGTRTLRIQASSDDAEQAGATMDLTSTDLDLAEKTVGVRFPSLGLPPGALILSAQIQFTADESQSGTTAVIIHSQRSTDALAFKSTDNDLTGRTLSTASVGWTIGAWSAGDAGATQRTPELASLLQELVDLQGWSSSSAVVLVFSATGGHRTAVAFDGDRQRTPELVVTYATELSTQIPTCATDLDRDADGFLVTPKATCDTLQETLGGLDAACGLPQSVTCTVVDRKDPNQTDIPDSFQTDVCEDTCTPNPVDAPECTEYDPVEFAACLERGNSLFTCKSLFASATHAGDDTPICVASGSPLAFDAVGRRSLCEVEGTSEITIGDREPQQDPATAGDVEILGGPCPGDDCFVHSSFLFAMEPITFSVRFARDPTFVNLGAAGTALDTTLLDAGLAGFEPDTVEGTGIGRRGDDGLAVTAANADVFEVGVDWTAFTCDVTGTLGVGVGDDGLCGDGTTACSSDDDCAAVGGPCEIPPDDDADMSVAVTLVGTLVNQPPDADAGADQSIECTSAAGGTFDLDGRASTDPDGNIALASWRAGSRTGAELSDDLRTTQALGVGGTETYVLRVMDTFAQLDEDTTQVSVVDTTPPTIACNAPATMRPRDTVSTFTATASDVCDTSVAATVTSYDCFAILGAKGQRVDKTGACKVSYSGGAFQVATAGGVGDHITWTVEAVDDAGNVGHTTCEVVVVNK